MEAFLQKVGMGEIPILAAIKAEKERLLQHFFVRRTASKVQAPRLGTDENERIRSVTR